MVLEISCVPCDCLPLIFDRRQLSVSVSSSILGLEVRIDLMEDSGSYAGYLCNVSSQCKQLSYDSLMCSWVNVNGLITRRLRSQTFHTFIIHQTYMRAAETQFGAEESRYRTRHLLAYVSLPLSMYSSSYSKSNIKMLHPR